MTPYAHPGDHLVDHLVRIELALDRAATSDVAELAQLDDAIARHDAKMIAREHAELPIVQLARRFDLSRTAVHVLIAAALPGLDVGLATRWQQVVRSGEPERRVHEVADLLGDVATIVGELAADQPLERSGLVALVSARDWAREAPLLQRIVTVPEGVVDALVGRIAFPARLGVVATRHPARVTGTPTDQVDTLRALIADRASSPIAVIGPALVGKAHAIAMAATQLGRGTIVASLDVIAAAGDPLRWLEELHRTARLLDDVLVLRTGDGLDPLPITVQRAVIGLANRGAAILTARDPAIARRLAAPRVVVAEVPDVATQQAVWHTQLGDGHTVDLEAVVARCSLPIGDIVEAAAAARSTVTGRPLATDDLVRAARARLQHRLSDVASVVSTTLTWGDLVVRDDIAQRIVEILAAVANRAHVLDAWGFGDKLPYGRSVSALLSGPPGTGKTMVATLIARELGLELFRVDLSKIVSKWIGETEKNLGKVFDEAARVGAVLLFDEADALFAKRTEVKSSNDRNANMEVNYLLQRLESHDGIVLLTTNSATSIDEAFQRRLRFRLEFPTPDAQEREALWRSMIPARAPVADDVDFAAIAARFHMAGGHIKNAVVRAAFLAAERGAHVIDHRTLSQAAALEWTELGNLPI